MRIIHNKQEVQKALNKSNFLSIFSFNAEPFVELIHFDVDDEITKEGEILEHLFYLVSGQAKLFLTLPNGKRTLIDFFNAPCFIGEMELLGVHTHSRSVQALVPCVCLALPLKSCRSQLLNDARFLRKLSLYLGNKNMRNVVSLAETKTYPLTNRLASFILLAAPNGHYKEMHGNAAEYLGVSYRHLLYVLAEFVQKGYLEKTNKGYHVMNKEVLIKLTKEMNSELNVSSLFANMDTSNYDTSPQNLKTPQ